jgi:hypothetical protein
MPRNRLLLAAALMLVAVNTGSCGSSTEPVATDGHFDAIIRRGAQQAGFAGNATYSISGSPSVELVPDLSLNIPVTSAIWFVYLTFPRGVRPKAGDVFPLTGGVATSLVGRGELDQLDLADFLGSEHEWTTTSGELRVQSVGGSLLTGSFTLAVRGVNTGIEASVTGSFRAQCSTFILEECS